MMGDNRDDSWRTAAIPQAASAIVPAGESGGLAQFLFFSTSASWLDPASWLFGIRFSRLLNGIH